MPGGGLEPPTRGFSVHCSLTIPFGNQLGLSDKGVWVKRGRSAALIRRSYDGLAELLGLFIV